MFPAGGLPSNMPQHDAAHDQGRRVAPSMRQATRPLQRRGAAGLRERLRLPQSEAPENESITPELGSRQADNLHRNREIPGEAGYMPLLAA